MSAQERFEKLPVKETIEIIPEEVKAAPQHYEKIGEERTFDGARQRKDGVARSEAQGEASGCPPGSETSKSTSFRRSW